MFKMIGNEITISKGDTYAFKIHLLLNGEPYILQSGDSVLAHIGQYSQTLTNDGFDYVIWQLPIALNTGRYKYDLTMCYSTGEQYHMNFPTKYDVVGNTEGGDTPEVLEDKTFTENGVYIADEGFAGFRTVTVDVPDPELEALNVTENGTYEPTVYGFRTVTVNVQPELEDKTITENGEYESEAYGFGTVTVNVQPELEDKTITENGVYESEAYGFGEITVEVEPNLQAKTVTENGTVTADDGYDGLSEVVVDCDTVPTIILSGQVTNGFSSPFAQAVLDTNLINHIATENISHANSMLKGFPDTQTIPFDINFVSDATVNISSLFQDRYSLKELPHISTVRPQAFASLLSGCHNLRVIPADFDEALDFTDSHSITTNESTSYIFNDCFSLRTFPENISMNGWNKYNHSINTPYTSRYYRCYAADEVIAPVIDVPYTANQFFYTFSQMERAKKIVFEAYDGTVGWSNQNIKLDYYVGYANNAIDITQYNSGITTNKMVNTAASYEALKNDPDWYAVAAPYSRYNHDSAVETINSLPTVTGAGNSITFKGQSGSATDGGAINTLTDTEIAVAAAKGWTVSLSN